MRAVCFLAIKTFALYVVALFLFAMIGGIMLYCSQGNPLWCVGNPGCLRSFLLPALSLSRAPSVLTHTLYFGTLYLGRSRRSPTRGRTHLETT